MSAATLVEWLAVRAEAGRREFADTMRALILQLDPALAERLPFERDQVFLEPGLFTVLAVPDPAGATMPQMLAAAIFRKGVEPCLVRSDADGTIDVPRVGRFRTVLANADFLLVRQEGVVRPAGAGSTPAFSFESGSRLGAIELYTSIPLHFRPLFPATGPDGAFSIGADVLADSARRALDAVARAWPEFGRCLRDHLRSIVAMADPRMNSFATSAAHGAIFVSVAKGLTVPQMIEELAHQGGHVLFNAATIRSAELFLVEPTSPMRSFSGDAGDSRSVYDALHGLVTEALMAIALDRCLNLRRWTRRERFELRGRLAYIGIRGHGDLASFSDPSLLSPLGHLVRDIAAQCLYPPLHRRRVELESLDLSLQPYAFDEAVYRQVNCFDVSPVSP